MEIPWRRKWQPAPVFLLGKSHEQRSLVAYSPWGHKESDMTEYTCMQIDIHMVESESWSLQSWPLQRQFCPIPNFPIYVGLFLGSAIYNFWILNIFMYYFKHTNRYHWISLSSSQSKKLAQNSQLCAQHWDGKNAKTNRRRKGQVFFLCPLWAECGVRSSV